MYYIIFFYNFIINNFINKIYNILENDSYFKNNNINYIITYRIKQKEKIIKKIFIKKRFPKDIFGLRIIYNNNNYNNDIETSYRIKKLLQNNFLEFIYFYDDYIKNSKINNYQSIHIYILYFLFFEIQIRNYNMHINSINGTASNYY